MKLFKPKVIEPECIIIPKLKKGEKLIWVFEGGTQQDIETFGEWLDKNKRQKHILMNKKPTVMIIKKVKKK